MGRKTRPADPQAILLRRARERHAERLRDRNPESWGIAAEIFELPTSADVAGALGHRNQVKWARRSDAFELLHAAKKYDQDGCLVAGISDAHKRAADGYVRDWMQRMGVGGAGELRDRVDETKEGPGRADVMVAAGQRLDDTHRRLGRTSRVVLRALVEPMVRGEVRVWRELVREATGEADRTAQATVVRVACEDLRLVHEEMDGASPREDAALAPIPIRVWRAEE